MSSTGVDGGAEGHGQGAAGAAPAIKQRRPKACDHWLKHGACQYGDKCHFSHSSVYAPTGSNTNDVRSDRRNDADKHSTGHNHGAPERRPHVAQELGASSNSKVCNHWLKHGSCSYGDKCHFRHPALPVSGKPMSNVDRNARSGELHKPRADRRGSHAAATHPIRDELQSGSSTAGHKSKFMNLDGPVTPEVLATVRKQCEFYLSDAALAQDSHMLPLLRKAKPNNAAIPLAEFLGYPALQKKTRAARVALTVDLLTNALRGSQSVVLEGDGFRRVAELPDQIFSLTVRGDGARLEAEVLSLSHNPWASYPAGTYVNVFFSAEEDAAESLERLQAAGLKARVFDAAQGLERKQILRVSDAHAEYLKAEAGPLVACTALPGQGLVVKGRGHAVLDRVSDLKRQVNRMSCMALTPRQAALFTPEKCAEIRAAAAAEAVCARGNVVAVVAVGKQKRQRGVQLVRQLIDEHTKRQGALAETENAVYVEQAAALAARREELRLALEGAEVEDWESDVVQALRTRPADAELLHLVTLQETLKKQEACLTEFTSAVDRIAQRGLPEGEAHAMLRRARRRLEGGLPIVAFQSRIVDCVERHAITLIKAETGSGKSTQVAPYLVDGLPWTGKVVVTQPRVVAAQSIAERVAHEWGPEAVGAAVGCHAGMRHSGSARTRIWYQTDRILLNEVVRHRHLPDVACVVIDEVHERSVETDLLLALLKDILQARPEFRVVVMSATLDPQVCTLPLSRPSLRSLGSQLPFIHKVSVLPVPAWEGLHGVEAAFVGRGPPVPPASTPNVFLGRLGWPCGCFPSHNSNQRVHPKVPTGARAQQRLCCGPGVWEMGLVAVLS